MSQNAKKNNFLWIFLVIILLTGAGFGIYYFTKQKSTQNPKEDKDIQYLPSEEISEQKIKQIQQEKGIDKQQATIEFLTAYVPEIKWWEINSLSELDEKIKLVNNKTGFPPFKSAPDVDKFNKEVENNIQKKSLLFLTSIIPRESNGTIDWKGLDFLTYLETIIKPQMEQIKFKPSFATQDNHQELGRRLTQQINNSLSSTCSKFSSLKDVSALNQLTNEYLSKIFQGQIYAEAIHDELGQQLAIANHQKFKLEGTGNSSENSSWEIALNEFAYKT